MARGMDMEGGAQYVLSYDAPRHLDTYVHRAGRTARAGHAGTALTLLEKKEVGTVLWPGFGELYLQRCRTLAWFFVNYIYKGSVLWPGFL